jgi:outer membrane protein OmpA-like peptidoglycan-associated protein
LQNKDAKTQSILSKYLAQIITQTSKEDAAGLSKSLQSVISPAISKEIADNKDTMIDALYPIMGGMISKYVTQAIKEMMETINNKIEDGLSFDKYKRKMKSKVTGVSETELLMEESSDATISSMFVIHKESGLLIAEAHLEDKEIDDAHMVASMASAIKDFINDWIKDNATQSEVQLLSYGNATLYIESAGSVYIIAFLDAEPDYEQRTEINTFFASVMKEYVSFFQKFDGDDSAAEIVTLSMKMEDYLYAQSSRKRSKSEQKSKIDPAKYILYFLAFVLIGYGIYQFNDWYIKKSLADAVYAQTGEQISIAEENDHLVLNGQVASTDVIYEIVSIMKRRTKEKIQNNLLVPMIYIDKRLKNERMSGTSSVSEIEKKMTALEKSFEKSLHYLKIEVSTLKEELTSSEEHLKQLLKRTTDEIKVLKEEKAKLKKVAEIQNEIFSRLDNTLSKSAFYNREDHALDFRKLAIFTAGNSEYEIEAMKIVAETFKEYMKIMVEYKEYIKHIIIEGHTDSSGLEEENIALSKKRALAVKYYLERLRIVKQYHMQSSMRIKGYGSAKAIVINGVEDKDASRRIKIKFELQQSQILDNLRRIIND